MRKMKICNSITNYFFVNCFPFFKLIHFLNTFLKPRQSNFKLVFSFGFLVIIRRISLPFFLNLEFKMWENISTSWRWRVKDLEVNTFLFLEKMVILMSKELITFIEIHISHSFDLYLIFWAELLHNKITFRCISVHLFVFKSLYINQFSTKKNYGQFDISLDRILL